MSRLFAQSPEHTVARYSRPADARARKLAGCRRRSTDKVLAHVLSAAAFGNSEQKLYASLLASAIVRDRPDLTREFLSQLIAVGVEF